MDVREEIQEKAKTAWLASNKKNTLILPTGSGKSKVAIDLLKEHIHMWEEGDRILLLTNSEELRDRNWKAEFEKWSFRWEAVESECYQTAYRWKDQHFAFVIADEIDFIAEEYKKFFENNTCEMILGLTGFIAEDKKPLVESVAPVCFEATTQEMQEDGLLNKSEFVLVYYPLNKEKTIKQKKKDGTFFFVSENDQYRYYNKMFAAAQIAKSTIEKKFRLQSINFEREEEWMAADWKFKIMAVKRKAILNNSSSSIKVTKALIEHIHRTQGNKILIFSALTKQADQLPNPLHGKNSRDNDVLEKLNIGSISTASVVKKVNRGQNLVGVNYLIYESYDGSETEFTQRHGRGLRLRPDQTLKVIVLIPMFDNQVLRAKQYVTVPSTTQAAQWAEKMMRGFDTSEKRTIQLDDTLTLRNGITV